jgi:preprotein translocase subunit Sss1
MGGEGHMLAMIRRDKDNQARKRLRRKKFIDNQEFYTTGMDDTLEFKEVSKEVLAELKQKNFTKIKQQEFKQFLKFIGIVILIGLIGYLFFELY